MGGELPNRKKNGKTMSGNPQNKKQKGETMSCDPRIKRQQEEARAIANVDWPNQPTLQPDFFLYFRWRDIEHSRLTNYEGGYFAVGEQHGRPVYRRPVSFIHSL